jgi:hypothetical protein
MDPVLIGFVSVFSVLATCLICFGIYLCVYHIDPEKELERERKRRLESEKLRKKIASKYSLVNVRNPIIKNSSKDLPKNKVEPVSQ